MALTVKWKAPIVITSLGAREDVNSAVHGYGGITLHDIITDRFARKAVEKGADGLIAVAAGAGGHAGSISPFALVQDIRAWFDGPLLLSGAIATGARDSGGRGRWAPTSPISARPSSRPKRPAPTTPTSRRSSRATPPTSSARSLFTGIFGNYLRPSIANAGLDPDNLPEGEAKTMNFSSGRRVGRQSLARHLGQRPGHRRRQDSRAGRRTRRAAKTRVCRGEEAGLRVGSVINLAGLGVAGWRRGRARRGGEARVRLDARHETS